MADSADRAARATRALIFDVGRVIVRVDVTRGLATLGASAGLAAEAVWRAIQGDPQWPDWQEGRIAPGDWHQHLARRFRATLSFEEFCAAWNSALDPQTLLGDAFFAQVAQRHRLLLLSNTDPLHVAHLEANFGFVKHFPARVYSCTAGVSKPDAAIYRRAIQEAGCLPEQILYMDDVADYVEAARRAGMQGLVFEGPEALTSELRRRGILP